MGIPDGAKDRLQAMIAAGEAVWKVGKPSGSQIRLSEDEVMMLDSMVGDREWS